MSSRIKVMRKKLHDELVRLETPRGWSRIVKQSGMFGSLPTGSSNKCLDKYHVHMVDRLQKLDCGSE